MELDTIVCGDCLDVMAEMPDGCVDLVVTDPPYPDIDKGFQITPIDFLSTFDCRQFIFWSAVEPFLLDWTAVHIWHKPNGRSSQHYERIFERNGKKTCRVFRYSAINSIVAASMARDQYFAHPTQKPLNLIIELLEMCPDIETVFDPFIGSGTTAVAALKLGRHFYGCDINPEYVKMANERIARARLEMSQMEMAL